MSEHCCDVVVHIDETLDDERIHELEKRVATNDGVYSACVHEKARHLMVVDYDPKGTSSRTILNNFTNQGLHAELIGL